MSAILKGEFKKTPSAVGICGITLSSRPKTRPQSSIENRKEIYCTHVSDEVASGFHC